MGLETDATEPVGIAVDCVVFDIPGTVPPAAPVAPPCAATAAAAAAAAPAELPPCAAGDACGTPVGV